MAGREMDHYDCVVIGAGYFGLAAARQYRWLCPDSSLAILESETSLGGSFADHRLYPGLKSNNLLGTFEYGDFPMNGDEFGVKSGGHIPGEAINRYLKMYAKEFGIAGLIQFDTKVLSAEHQDTPDGGWVLTVADSLSGNEKRRLYARRLIVSTGLTSQPLFPHFEGQETFGGPVFHTKDFLYNRDTILQGSTVTVLGGGKSAWDAVYTYATAGVKVNWVISSTGRGPCWMTPPFVTPLKKWIEHLANIRFLTWFSPCIWGDSDGYGFIRRLLHGTFLGRLLVNMFWKVLATDVMGLNNYDNHPKTAKLKPWSEAMFTGPSFSILNYDTDVYDLIKSDLVDLHIADIDHLGPGKVYLTDGGAFESHSVLANTGWNHVPPIKFLPEGIEQELGIPHDSTERVLGGLGLGNQHELIHEADEDILQRFPRLRDQPVGKKGSVATARQQHGVNCPRAAMRLTPFMLHHFLVPPSERFLKTRDIAFTGMVASFSTATTAQVQGLWVAAYFARRLARDPADAVGDEQAMSKLRYEAVLYNRFGRWRYPTDWGSRAPSFIFDAVPYLDLLQRDLGLSPYRKKGPWAEIWHPYGPWDYRSINEEWWKIYGSRGGID